MEKSCIISIDMGGTKMLAAKVSSKEGIVARVKKATKVGKEKINYAKALYELIEETKIKAEISDKHIKAICLGVPGSVNVELGKIGMAPNLGIKNYFIQKELQKFTSIPVLVENDVNLAALGGKAFGHGIGKKNILSVFVGTGIGAGIILDGKIYRGSSFLAGEIGHLIVNPKGVICGCGMRGCFETEASRTAIVRKIVKEIKAGKKSKLSELVKTKTPIKSKALAAAVRENDKVTIKYVDEACNTIGAVLANCNNLMNFELIVLGGGVIEALNFYMVPKIKEAFLKFSLSESAKAVKILPTKLGDDAALYGGIVLVEELLGIKI